MDVDVRGRGAVACVLTQGGQRVYRPGEERFRRPPPQKRNNDDDDDGKGVADEKWGAAALGSGSSKTTTTKTCRSSIRCTIEPGSTLLYPLVGRRRRRGTHVVRVLAESNEDVYRVLHFCLRPLARRLGGMEPYRDRIHSSRTVHDGRGRVI